MVDTVTSMLSDMKHTLSPVLSNEQVALMHRYWSAANYLTVGQIYLMDNTLLREPLKPEHIKPRLLGHWGTSVGLSLIYIHINRLINEYKLNCMFMAGPGHGGPAVVACTYLEKTYSSVFPKITYDAAGIRALFRQFSTPGGIPSHVSAPTPGSIHEGGELGYVLAHAFGSVMDNPSLLTVAVVGDGEAETGPLEGSWKCVSFVNPVRDGAVLPILHLNGYKISGPTVMGRATDAEIKTLMTGHGYTVYFAETDDPNAVHQLLAATLNSCVEVIKNIQAKARAPGANVPTRPHWPMIVLRTPKGWTGPDKVDGVQVQGTFRAHQVPITDVKGNPEHLKILEQWMLSYKPHELFDEHGVLVPELQKLAPVGSLRMSANPNANGGTYLKLNDGSTADEKLSPAIHKSLIMPDVTSYEIKVTHPATERVPSTSILGKMLRDVYKLNPTSFRLFCPDETNSNKLGAVFDVEKRMLYDSTPVHADDDHVSSTGRVMEVLSEHLCSGWMEAYNLTGRYGLFASYEAFTMIVASMVSQHGKWLEECEKLKWRSAIPSYNILLTSTCWRNDHNGFSHQGPGFMDVVLTKRATVSRIYLPVDANTLLCVGQHCLQSTGYINCIIQDKQPQFQYLTMDDAKQHCKDGAGIWQWCSNVGADAEPDIVLGCAGDIPTQETVAAAAFLRENVPDLKVRVVNVVDLMTMFHQNQHPHGMSEQKFQSLFTKSKHVVFAFHGYAGAVDHCVHGRNEPNRFHIHGFEEQGTTTTPFDMVVLNNISRFHLAMTAVKYGGVEKSKADDIISKCQQAIQSHTEYAHEHFKDQDYITDFKWTAA